MNARRYGASLIGLGALGLILCGCGSSTGQQGGTGGSGTGGAASGTGGSGSGGSSATGGTSGGACSSALSARVKITEVDVGATYAYNEVDNNGAALGLTPLAISPI